jgi:glycosyltransferase involved in cell wall biosynthesis
VSSRVVALVLSYNDAATIADTIKSIVQQDRVRELQAVVLGDDGSRDDSVERARRAAGDIVSLHVLTRERNVGPWPNLNESLRYVSTVADWALLLHADDLANPGWLAALLTRIERCSDDVATISTSWDMLYGSDVKHTGERGVEEVRVVRGSHAAVRDTLLKGCWWKISGAAFRTRAFLDIADFDSSVHQSADWDWSMRALDRGWSIEYIPRPLTLYRQHAATMSTSSLRNDVDILDAMRLLDRFGHTLTKREVAQYHVQRGRFALRRLARGLTHGDARRVAVSARTMAMLTGHLMRRLVS